MPFVHAASRAALLAAAASFAVSTTAAQAGPKFQVLYSFSGKKDGRNPHGPLMLDKQGNLYGTTVQGGKSGYGVVFRLAPDRKQSVLYSFTRGEDGGYAYGGLVQDKADNLYGVTVLGGPQDEGLVYKLASDGKQTVLHSFSGIPDGSTPESGLVLDKAGNLYGTTPFGGYGPGTIFKLTPKGKETILHNFADGYNDGAYPYGGVTIDKKGNLYGTTNDGGSGGQQQGPGIIYKLAANGKFSVLYHFGAGADGGYPAAAPAIDASGNLYGTTIAGGDFGEGVLYKLTPDGTYTVLHSFGGSGDGEYGIGRPVMDGDGSLYGVTKEGGGACGCGIVFKLAPDGSYSVLHSFAGKDGREPGDGLMIDKQGNLFGTTYEGGKNDAGTVFKIGK
jgi:uncharacterized repeat protein (TIGR03803 family)